MSEARIDMLTDEGVTVPAGAEELVRAALKEVAEEKGDFCADILFTDEEEIRRLNREFRKIDRVTDVLSFPAEGEEPFLGDIAICVPRAEEQAREIGNTPQREIAFLAVHGSLHLFGYDHETEAEEAEMLTVQRAVMDRVPREA